MDIKGTLKFVDRATLAAVADEDTLDLENDGIGSRYQWYELRSNYEVLVLPGTATPTSIGAGELASLVCGNGQPYYFQARVDATHHYRYLGLRARGVNTEVTVSRIIPG